MILSLRRILGLNNKLPEYNLTGNVEFVGRKAYTDTFLTEANNVDITDQFQVRRRDGMDRVVFGNIHSIWSDGNVCLYREGTTLKLLSESYSYITLRNDLTSLKVPMNYLSLLGKVYYTDGYSNGVVEHEQSRTWGLPIPTKPTINIISGNMIAGNYMVGIVHVRENGMISGADNPDVKIVNNNSALQLSNIPVSSDATVKYVDIYLTRPSGSVMYFYRRLANGTMTHTINKVDLNASYPLQALNLHQTPMGNLIGYYNSRIYVVDGSVIWYSIPFSYEMFNLSEGHITMESNVNMIEAVKDGIWVGTNKKIYYFGGNNPPFRVDEKADYGVTKGSATIVPGDLVGEKFEDNVIMFFTNEGICIGGNGGLFRNLTRDNYSFPTSDIGTSLFKQRRGYSQYIVSLKKPINAENIYE
jgi:hypothetical protein